MRLAGRVKMGFYPTPLSVIERIKTFLKVEEKAAILDPCCGEGIALHILCQGTSALACGIELDKHRAKEAKKILNHVIQGSYEEVRMSNSFSCLFLNPPYDWATEENLQERKEKMFLQGTWKALMPKGIVIFLIPQHRMDRQIARWLSQRVDNVAVFRFPDPEYEQFKQIVLFGRKKEAVKLDDSLLQELSQVREKDLPPLPMLDAPLYTIPGAGEIKVFQLSVPDVAQVEKELERSPAWTRIKALTNNTEQNLSRPPLPLHSGHIALLLANGLLDGIVGEGKDKHLVKGCVKKIVIKSEEIKGDVVEEREFETYKVSVKLLKPTGEIITLL